MTTPNGGRSSQPPNPKYMTDFSKALAGEVKILLSEVGKLRDEKRELQYEISELMAIKAKHSAEGIYAGWMPPPPTIEPPPLAMIEPPPPAAPAPGGWRTVSAPHVPRARRVRAPQAAAPPPAPTPAPMPPPTPVPNLPAWANWRPNPLLAAPVAPGRAMVTPPPRTGLFGPRTPPPQ